MKPATAPVSAKALRHLNDDPHRWDDINAVVIGVDQAVRDVEATWGVGRVVNLVSDATRLQFQKGHALWSAAISSGNLAQVRDLGPKMIAAWQWMGTEADSRGHAPLSVDAFEARMPDGRVMAIVRTNAEAIKLSQSGRAMVVYTVDELARLIPHLDLLNAVKTEFEGAIVSKVTTHGPGYGEAWATSSDFLALHELEEVAA